VVVTAYLLPGVAVSSFGMALLVAIILALLNTFLRPLLIILTLPITLFTLGIFLLFINAFIIYVIHKILPGFTVNSVWWAILFSLILSLLSSLLEKLVIVESNRRD